MGVQLKFDWIRDLSGHVEIRCNCGECATRVGTADNSGHLYYNREKNVFFCFRCGYEGRGFPNGVPWENQTRGGTLSAPMAMSGLPYNSVHGVCKRAADLYFTQHHINPLSRVVEYGVRLDGPWLIFPYPNRSDNYQICRNVFEKVWLCPPNVDKPIYWTTEDGGSGAIIIVESVVNAIRLCTWGVCAALGGTNITPAMIEELAARIVWEDRRVVIALDNDALYKAVSLARTLRTACVETSGMPGYRGEFTMRCRFLFLPRGDVCDYPDDELLGYMRRSRVWEDIIP